MFFFGDILYRETYMSTTMSGEFVKIADLINNIPYRKQSSGESIVEKNKKMKMKLV